ncbi:MAG: PIN domain-containing protein [Candidatus Korobacteraceae bacterium]
MKTRVLDSWPILEWIKERQPVTDIVDNLLADAESGVARLFVSAINVGEVYYYVCKYHSETLAESWRESSSTLPLTVEIPTMEEIWDAALMKGKYPIAYADAFAAALAQKHRCPLVTGDPGFRSIPDLELDWIGPATT